MKRPYGVFSQDGEAVKLVAVVSGRFARANRHALEYKKSYPGVFFAYIGADNRPEGERFRPKRVGESRVKTGFNPQAGRSPKPVRRKMMNESQGAYYNPDPETGESLADIHVEAIRRQAARGASR